MRPTGPDRGVPRRAALPPDRAHLGEPLRPLQGPGQEPSRVRPVPQQVRGTAAPAPLRQRELPGRALQREGRVLPRPEPPRGIPAPRDPQRNPAFSRFLKRYDLADLTRAYPADFNDKAILTRQDLYRRLCEIIWDPARLGFTIPAARRITGPAAAHAPTTESISRTSCQPGCLRPAIPSSPSTAETSTRRSSWTTGESSWQAASPSPPCPAPPPTPGTRRSANGWEFWHLQTRRERRPLKELRDELIRAER